MLDLHTHSIASDGSLTPDELVTQARKTKLTAFALTDHDTVAGIQDATIAARRLGQGFIPGIELSAKIDTGSCHIVGLHIDPNNQSLTARLESVRKMRDERNPRLVGKLQELNVPVTLEEATEASGGGVVGRPHFAQVMISKGYVSTAEEAFEKYLGTNGRAHVHKERLDPENAIELIRAAGGVPILAHPRQTRLESRRLDDLVHKLTELGLAGIETMCTGYTAQENQDLGRLAKKYGLVRSGGSDFHGAQKPRVRLGRGLGPLYVPDDLLDPIAKAAQAIRREG